MRILQVAASVNPKDGGVAEGVLQQSLALTRLGVDVEVLSADEQSFPSFTDGGVPHHALDFQPGRWRKTPGLPEWMKENLGRFDGMILNGIWQHPICAAGEAARNEGTPYWVMPHGMMDPYFKRNLKRVIEKSLYWALIEGKTISGSRGLLFTTEEELQAASRAYGIDAVKKDVVGYGIATEWSPSTAEERAELMEQHDLPEGFLLYMSRFDEKKGFDLILEAMTDEAWPKDMVVAAAGSENEYLTGLKRQAESLGVSQKLRWLGFVSGSQKQAALDACGAMILPSHQENFGVIVAEALRSGKPVLISNKVNTWREVADGACGYVAADTKAGVLEMVSAFSRASDPALPERAKQCFADWFAVDRAAQRLLDVLCRELPDAEAACA